ncbi:HD domain-containing protein [Actinopolyspora xinjiangensis]|uniref:HD domain-containing protein n=1 Tax=Actinopolyspora xinjiangensis TaxID=405564 RepID=A0A1H0WCR9_9ACTN|nr:HD domain-containing protein [Actinopolyspora xinjiangensis]SDP88106.1 HD domain-containing protein [Actinopolyspora xinjiangensis]
MELVQRAAEVAESFVKPLGRRWFHVQAVAARAEELRDAVPSEERDILVAAAWLHDIGYAPEIAHTGFHPLDGARYLRDQEWPDTIVNLVAHHSGARFEAEERDIGHKLSEFPFEDSPLLDALVAADLTTGPAGERLSYNERMDEILSRYAPGDPVHRTWTRARPVIAEAVGRAERRLAEAQPR